MKPLPTQYMTKYMTQYIIRSITSLLLVLFVSGCAVNQERDVKLYRDVLDAEMSAPDRSFSPENPLTLEQAMELANAHNEQLAITGEDFLQTLINKDRAFAAFLPTIRLAPAFMRQEKTSLGADNPLITEFMPEETMDLPIEGNMNLNLVRDWKSLKAADASIRMKRAGLLDRQSILMLDVAETYYQIMHSEEKARVLQNTLGVYNCRLMDVRVKARVGVARPMDVSLAEAQLAEIQNRLIQVADDVKNGRTMLAFLIGVSEIAGPLTNRLAVSSAGRQMAHLQMLADSHRQDLIAAHETVALATAEVEAAWGKYFPEISLNLSSYLSRDSFPSDVDWTAVIQANIPIFSAGLIHADVRAAYSKLRQAHLAERYIQRKVQKDLQLALDNLERDDQQIHQLGIQVTAAQAGLKQANAAFSAGIGTNLERLTAQDGLLSAELALTTATFNFNIDYLRLLRAAGVLTPNFSPLATDPQEMEPSSYGKRNSER